MTVGRALTRWSLLGLLLLGLSSCGGGTGGTGSPVVAVGTVMALGSIVVNGLTFDTTGAAITRDGQPGTPTALRVGHVVTVRGTLRPDGLGGTAESVALDLQIIGPLSRLDLAANRLVVLGQDIRLESTTRVDMTLLQALALGNIVAVSGFTDADGVLRATRIDRLQEAFTPDTELALDGTVSNLDPARRTFTLQGLRVDFSTARLLSLPENQLRNGQVVTIMSRRPVLDGVLAADSVTGKNVRLQDAPGVRVELQGIVTHVSTPQAFEINGRPAQLTPSTVFEGGTAADLGLNVQVEIEGFLATDGTVLVEEVAFGASIERRGSITRSLSIDTFEVDGRPVRLTPTTVFEGGTAADLTLDVRLKVEGFLDAEGRLVATEIDFFSEIEGRISRVTAPHLFEVNGQPVRLTPNTVFEGGTAADLALNVPVEVTGFFDGEQVLVATEIEFLF